MANEHVIRQRALGKNEKERGAVYGHVCSDVPVRVRGTLLPVAQSLDRVGLALERLIVP